MPYPAASRRFAFLAAAAALVVALLGALCGIETDTAGPLATAVQIG